MPEFDIRAARITWTVFLVALALFLIYSIRTTLLVMLCAVFFSYLLLPLVQRVDRQLPARVPRTAAIALVFLLVFVGIGIGGALLGSRIADEAARLGQQLPNLLNTENLSQRIPLPGFLEPQRGRLVSFISAQLQAGTGQAVPFAQRFGIGLVHAASNLIYLVLVPILAFLLINEAASLKREALALLRGEQHSLWEGIADDINLLLAGYVRALTLLSLAAFVTYGLVLSLMGVPYALLLGGIAALLEIVPVLGPLIAAALIVVVSTFSGFEHLWWLIGFIVAYRIFQDYVLSPRLLSDRLEISALMVIFGLIAGDELAGIAGIFLSVPVLATLKIMLVRLGTARAAAKAPAGPAESAEAPKLASAVRRAPPADANGLQQNPSESAE
jgi:predicted PurR-regulated permease PerM